MKHLYQRLTGSIASKLMALMIGVSLVASSAITLNAIVASNARLEHELENQAEVLLKTLAHGSREGLFERVADLQALAAAASDSDNVSAVKIYDNSGVLLVDTGDENFRISFEADPFGQALIRNQEGIQRPPSDESLILGQPVVLGTDVLGAVVVELSTAPLEESQSGPQLNALFMMFIVTLIAIIVLIWFTRRFTRPLHQLTTAAAAFGQGQFEHTVAIHTNDEFATLGLTFNQMASELKALVDNLESRVAARTRDLAWPDVSRQVTTYLDVNALLPQLVNDLQSAFELYHVSVFTLNEAQQTLRYMAGTGHTATLLKQEGKSFKVSAGVKGLVPQAAMTREAALANDVTAATTHLHNHHLPQTQSELAIPMVYGERLIGILDLQSAQAGRFGEDDVRVLTSLAEQMAIAIRNAQLFAEMQVAHQAAEQASKVKSQFLASVSHELRTPLNGILNFTGFVADGMLGPVNEEQVKVLNDAIQNAEHLLALINDVLDISKIESGSLKLFVEDDVNLTDIVNAVATTGHTLLDDKAVRLELDVADDLPTIRADKRRVRQILLNLVSNACKFTEQGRVTIAAERQNGQVRLAVRDTGPGIAREEYDSVFETFTQTQTGLRQGSGTGLGLPISRRLAEAHGGQLWLESELGQGATFFVSLPIHSAELEVM